VLFILSIYQSRRKQEEVEGEALPGSKLECVVTIENMMRNEVAVGSQPKPTSRQLVKW
jgi:hypothetical protein